MDGFRVFINFVCICIFATGPMRLSDFITLGNTMGGGGAVATLVHGDLVTSVIASARAGIANTAHGEPTHTSAAMSSLAASSNMNNAATADSASALWRWQSTITPDSNTDDWKLGSAVSIHQRTLAVGPARDWDIGVDQGGVQLYTRSGLNWLQSTGLAHPSRDIHAQYGSSVCLQNKILLVGAPRDSQDACESGAAYVYEQVDDQWHLGDTLLRLPPNEGDQFGAAVACNTNTLVIGAPKANQGAEDSGAVEVFERGAHGWLHVATLVANPPTAGALFGLSVAIDGDHIIVGAPGDRTDGTFSGRASIFTRTPNGWTRQTTLSCPVGGRGWFGHAVATSQGRVLVGAPRLTRANQTDFDARGAAFEFQYTSAGWQHVATITPANTLEGDSFACSLALHQQRAVFGASSDSLAGRLAGAAFAGARMGDGVWNVQRLRAPDCAQEQLAGHAVAIFGSSIAVGRLGNPEEDPAPGAVSLFSLIQPQVTQEDLLTTSSMGRKAAP